MGRLVPLSLILIAGLLVTAGSAGAQTTQHNTIEPGKLTWHELPEAVPGTFQGTFPVTINNAGGMCLCTRTTVHLATAAPEEVQVVVTPTSYAVDWLDGDLTENPDHDTREIELTVFVPSQYAGELVKVDVQPIGQTDSFAAHAEGLRATYAVPVPSVIDAGTHTAQETTQDNGDGDGGATDGEAGTQSAEDAELSTASVSGLGAAAATLTAAMAAVAWRRGRA